MEKLIFERKYGFRLAWKEEPLSMRRDSMSLHQYAQV